MCMSLYSLERYGCSMGIKTDGCKIITLTFLSHCTEFATFLGNKTTSISIVKINARNIV